MPGTSEATKDSPSPTPITTGGPERAAIILFGSAAERTPSANAPVSRFTARRTASSSMIGLPAASASFCTCSIRCAMISVSVSVTNLWPLADQLVLQLQIVFDNAVVHHHDAARAVAMRMGILFRGPAMRGPARMANAEGAFAAGARAAPLPGCPASRERGEHSSVVLDGLPTAMPAES